MPPSSGAYILGPISDRKVGTDRKGRQDEGQRTIDQRAVRALVDRARGGDRDAFGEAYKLCHGAVSRFVRFHLPGSEGEDAVAETFMRAWVALPRYRDTGAPFTAWLIGIARHVVADAHRARRRSEPWADPPDRAVEFHDEATDRLAIAEALRGLPEEQRTVIEYKFLVGWTNEEVGQAMGKSAGAVNALQWRALHRLKKILEGR